MYPKIRIHETIIPCILTMEQIVIQENASELYTAQHIEFYGKAQHGDLCILGTSLSTARRPGMDVHQPRDFPEHQCR